MKKIFALAMLLILIACAQPLPQPTPKPIMEEIQIVTPSFPEKPKYEPPPTEPTIVEIKIEAKRFEFLPSEIKVKKGDNVRLIVTSVDVPHTFTMIAYGIDEELPVGEDIAIEFVADKEGIFTFTCGIPGHEENGMKGKLIVT